MGNGIKAQHKYCGQWCELEDIEHYCQACQDIIISKRLTNKTQPIPICRGCQKDIFDDESVGRCMVDDCDQIHHKQCGGGWKLHIDGSQTCHIHSETTMDIETDE